MLNPKQRDNLPGPDAEMRMPGETEPEMIRRILKQEIPAILERWADERARAREQAEFDREKVSFGDDGIPD